jgi:hypothetical protein
VWCLGLLGCTISIPLRSKEHFAQGSGLEVKEDLRGGGKVDSCDTN